MSTWLYDPDGTLLEGPQGPVSHLVCDGMNDWSTGLIYKDRHYFDPNLGIWLTLLPLMVVKTGRRRPKERHLWIVMVFVGIAVTGTLLSCSPSIDYETVEAILCTEIPPTPPMHSVAVRVEPVSGANAQPNGSHDWRVKFDLVEEAPADGWIVQEIDIAEYKYNSESNVWEQGNSPFHILHYWEAWWVKEGRTTRDRLLQGHDDQYAAESGPALTPPYTIGWKQVKGTVEFYTGGSKPDPIWSNVGDVPAGEGWDEGDWRIRKLVGADNGLPFIPAGDLPATEIPPKFWDYCGTSHDFEIFWDDKSTWGMMRWENNVHSWGTAPAGWTRPQSAWYGL